MFRQAEQFAWYSKNNIFSGMIVRKVSFFVCRLIQKLSVYGKIRRMEDDWMFYFAPMEGITIYLYRNAFAKYFDGIDKYFTPFIMPNKKRVLKTREMNDILPEHNEGLNVVPQILTKNAADFIDTAKKLQEMGYEEVNLNLGCPSKTVVSKGKGAGMLKDLDTLDDFLTEIFDKLDMKISIKTRIGMYDPEEFHSLMIIFNGIPSKVDHSSKVQEESFRNPSYGCPLPSFRMCEVPSFYNVKL